MNHNEVQADLAAFLRRQDRPGVIFTELALTGKHGSAGRLDVVRFTSAAQYKKVHLSGFEVKASRSDLMADLRAEKWKKYRGPVNQLYFAFPDGMADRDDIPEQCGVVVRLDDGSWKFIRRAPSLDHIGKGPTREVLARLVWRADEMTQQERAELIEVRRAMLRTKTAADEREQQMRDTIRRLESQV